MIVALWNPTGWRFAVYEVVLTAAPRSERSPLHVTYDDALHYLEANVAFGEGYEVWQVADDVERTRVCCVLSALAESNPATELDVTLDIVAALDGWTGLMGSESTHVERADADPNERSIRLELDNGQTFDIRVREGKRNPE